MSLQDEQENGNSTSVAAKRLELEDKEDSGDETIVTTKRPELEDEDLQAGDGRESKEPVGALEEVRF